MKDQICIVGESGGMLNAYGSGFLYGASLTPEMFSAGIGVSSSAMMLAFFFSGRTEAMREMWTNVLTSREIFSWLNTLKIGRPVDIDRLIQVSSDRMDLGLVMENTNEFLVEVYNATKMVAEYHQLHDGFSHDLLKATCALPLFSRPIRIGDEVLIDGGTYDPLPVKMAYERGYRKILVVHNKPRGYVYPYFSSLKQMMLFPNLPNARQELNLRIRRHQENLWFLRHPPQDCKVYEIFPSRVMCEILERNSDVMKQVYESGFDHGVKESKKITDWIYNDF